MQRKAWIETAVFAGLVLAAAAARITFRELPNFAPIAAMSLFAGYYFRSPLVAIAVPLAAMLLSDMVLGGYEWQMMLVVYGMLVLPVAFRGPLRRWLRIEKGAARQGPGGARRAAGMQPAFVAALFPGDQFCLVALDRHVRAQLGGPHALL